jgi:hypothetical protein
MIQIIKPTERTCRWMHPAATVSGGNSSSPNLARLTGFSPTLGETEGQKQTKEAELECLRENLYTLSTEEADGQAKAFIHTITMPLSEGERKDFESKLSVFWRNLRISTAICISSQLSER